MNFHSSTIKKYYPALVGAALISASLFQFSRPVFSAGTEAGQKIRNTATGTYKDDAPIPNTYTIDSNTVEVTVAKVAGITNMPSGVTDETTSATNTSVLENDNVSFEFTITNVGNDISNIYIPDKANIKTKGLDRLNPNDILVEVSQLNPGSSPTFVAYSTLAGGIFQDVPINGHIIVKVTGKVTASAAGAPIEVRLGDTGSNTDINVPVADTQNQFDHATTAGGFTDVAKAANEVRTLEATTPTAGVTALTDVKQKEASAVQQVSLGSNPLAMAKIEKTRGTVLNGTSLSSLADNIVPYSLKLEVQSKTPNEQYIPGQLKGRDFEGRITGASITDDSDLILVSDAIPEDTVLEGAPTGSPTDWTPVYATGSDLTAADTLEWTTDIPTDFTTVTRIGWVYDARATPAGKGPIDPGTTISGFDFNVVTTGLDADTGGTVANLAQVFGGTVNGSDIFDESGDQDPSNFSGSNPGPSETATGSTGIANPAGHGVDSKNNNNATSSDTASPGGEDNVITISAPGTLINGPLDNATATGSIFGEGPDSNHDFQNLGIDNFKTGITCTTPTGSGNAQQGKGCKLDPNVVEFNNTLSNPGDNDLTDVLLQPIHPSFNSFGGNPATNSFARTDTDLPKDTKVTIKLGAKQAIYTYKETTPGVYRFVLDSNTALNPSVPIKIPTLAAGVPLDYKVFVDLPADTKLSTEVEHGYAVPIIAFVDGDDDGTPDSNENSNYTVNQVYTDFIEITKQVKVMRDADGDGKFEDGEDVSGMGYDDADAAKKPLPGDALVYRVNYRNISEPQTGNGSNLVLNGKDVMIDENGTQANITGMTTTGNNWGLDNNGDDDLDTIHIQDSAIDSSSGSTVTYWTGTSLPASTDKYSVETLTSAGTNDPGETVTGYRSTIPTLAPSEDNSTFVFQRKVDEYDGLAQEELP
jgi:hypothetical protein